MSTFGKKSLCWWDYNDHSKENAIRYQHTPNDLQLKILEMWYPVGARFKISTKYSNYTIVSDLFEIKSYVEHLGSWSIDYQHVDIGKRVASNYSSRFTSGTITPINPVYIEIEPETLVPLKRGFKLDKLLSSKKNHTQ